MRLEVKQSSSTALADEDLELTGKCQWTMCENNPKSWKDKCGWRSRKCRDCPQCAKFNTQTTARIECAAVCASHKDGWVGVCAWRNGKCSKCKECDTHKCSDDCLSNKNDWDEKCAWTGMCGGCAQCRVPNVKTQTSTAISTRAATKRTPQCLSLCVKHPHGWAKICAWVSLNCSACPQCNTHKCHADCTSNKKAWDKKCPRTSKCGGCEECSEPAVKARTIATPATPVTARLTRNCETPLCKNHEDGWAKVCAWGSLKCSACPECSTHKCAEYCTSNNEDWMEKCAWTKTCGGCAQCSVPAVMARKNISTMTNRATKATPQCLPLCSKLTDGWVKVCAWESLKCSACEECSTHKCDDDCTFFSEAWNEKCAWTHKCGGCAQCSVPAMSAHTLNAATTTTTSTRECDSICALHEAGWAEVCAWGSLKCSACKECGTHSCSDTCATSEKDWEENCKLTSICGGCAECSAPAVKARTTMVIRFTMPTPQCLPVCSEHKDGWVKVCAWGNLRCSACPECSTHKCQDDCISSVKTWEEKCKWTGQCGGCIMCSVPNLMGTARVLPIIPTTPTNMKSGDGMAARLHLLRMCVVTVSICVMTVALVVAFRALRGA